MIHAQPASIRLPHRTPFGFIRQLNSPLAEVAERCPRCSAEKVQLSEQLRRARKCWGARKKNSSTRLGRQWDYGLQHDFQGSGPVGLGHSTPFNTSRNAILFPRSADALYAACLREIPLSTYLPTACFL